MGGKDTRQGGGRDIDTGTGMVKDLIRAPLPTSEGEMGRGAVPATG